MDPEAAQTAGALDEENLQAWAARGRDGVAEAALPVHEDADQHEDLEPGEHPGWRQDEAEKRELEYDGGGSPEAREQDGPSLFGLQRRPDLGLALVPHHPEVHGAGEAARGDGEPDRQVLDGGLSGGNLDVAEVQRFVGGEGGDYAVVLDAVGEGELREEGPEAAPPAGEDAGPGGGRGVAELDEDADEHVVWKRAEAVLAACSGVGIPTPEANSEY